MKLKLALLCVLGAAASANALACYTVYDSNQRVVYNASTPPVDMSLPLHQTLPRRFPGGHMVFDAAAADCPVVTPAAPVAMNRQPATTSSPLLTDERTARALGVPHGTTASGAAVIAPQALARMDLPTFSVIQTSNDVAVAGTAATQTLGAGPARMATQSMGAGPAPAGRVITEVQDPSITVIQNGRDIIIRQR